MKNQRKATLYALLAIGFWSTVGTAFKISLQSIDFLHLVLYSSWVSLVVLGFYISFTRNWTVIQKTNRSEIMHSALLGFLNPFLYYTILLKAYSVLPAQEAVVLNYTWPIVLLLLSIPLMKQKVGFGNLAAIFISFTGTIVTVTHANISNLHFENPIGTVFALSSALVWASFWIFNAKDHRDELNKLFYNFLFGSVYTLIFLSSLYDTSNGMTGFWKYIFPELPVKAYLGVMYIGLFEMGITFIFWMKAMQLTVSTAKITNLIYISPFISLILVGMVLGEKILPSTIIGLILIVAGILLQRPLKNST